MTFAYQFFRIFNAIMVNYKSIRFNTSDKFCCFLFFEHFFLRHALNLLVVFRKTIRKVIKYDCGQEGMNYLYGQV